MSRAPCRPWRMSEIRAVEAAIATGRSASQTARDLAPELLRSVWSVKSAALRRKRPTGQPPAHHRHWSAADIEALDAAIGSGTTLPWGGVPRLARSLGRTVEATRRALWRRRIALGLVRRWNGGGR